MSFCVSIRIWKIVKRQQQKVMSAHSVELLYYAAGLSRALIVNKVVLRFFFWVRKGKKKMFYVTWDPETGGVRLTQSPKGLALNVSPRPVFYEELDFLKMKDCGWSYPECSEPLLWACERRYFYRGELVLEVHGGNIFDPPTVNPKITSLNLTPTNLPEMFRRNENALFILEHEAMNFIDETYRRYSGIAAVSDKNPDIDFQELANRQTQKTKEEHVVVKEDCDSFDIMPLREAERLGKKPILSRKVEMFVASFSGGKDSQVVLDLVSRVIPPEEFLVIYSDTGYELPSSLALFDEVQAYYKNRYPELRFYTARNQQPVLYYWDQMGSPSRIHRWCCAVMKTAPLYKLIKTIAGTTKQPFSLAFEGVRAEESDARSSYARIGKGVKHNNVINARPIFEWNTTEVWLYILLNQLPINKAYRKGLNRVGCVVCPLSSEFGDCLDNLFFPETAKPFIEKLEENAKKSGITNIDNYIKERKWKVRAGGNNFVGTSRVEYISISPDFKAKIYFAKENIFEWIKTLGETKIDQVETITKIQLKSNSELYNLTVNHNKDCLELIIPNIGDNVSFISHLKRVINKSAYCVHCEVCEIECPTGALIVTPAVHIDESKCIHCKKCLDFIDMGCEVANSTKKSTIISDKNMDSKRSAIKNFNTFGFREHWLSYFFENHGDYFDNIRHGLNVQKQLPIFKKWLKDAEILNEKPLAISATGDILAKAYPQKRISVWEIIWINLCDNNELMAWYIEYFPIYTVTERNELDAQLTEAFPQYTIATRENAIKAFINTFKESPLGSTIPVGKYSKDGNKVSLSRQSYDNLSLVATAYSIYRYAEKAGRRSLTISEFYNENQTEGVYRQFGISREALERKLRSLQEEENHVLSVELNMGLDNIILRDDLTSFDILKMLL